MIYVCLRDRQFEFQVEGAVVLRAPWDDVDAIEAALRSLGAGGAITYEQHVAPRIQTSSSVDHPEDGGLNHRARPDKRLQAAIDRLAPKALQSEAHAGSPIRPSLLAGLRRAGFDVPDDARLLVTVEVIPGGVGDGDGGRS